MFFAFSDNSCSVNLISQSTHYYWKQFFDCCTPRMPHDTSMQVQHSWRALPLHMKKHIKSITPIQLSFDRSFLTDIQTHSEDSVTCLCTARRALV